MKIAAGGHQGNRTRNRQVLREIYRVGVGRKEAQARERKTVEGDSRSLKDHKRHHAHRRRDDGERVATPAVRGTERTMEQNLMDRFTLF